MLDIGARYIGVGSSLLNINTTRMQSAIKNAGTTRSDITHRLRFASCICRLCRLFVADVVCVLLMSFLS